MIRYLTQEARHTNLTADVCIIGAGAAGISIALELINSGKSVVVLEAGGREYSARAQQLYAGKILNRPYFQLDVDRVRILGGTTFHWGGWCGPLTQQDLAERAWVPESGWPLSWEELEVHYPRAQELCELSHYNYNLVGWLEASNPPLPFNSSLLEHFVYQFSPPTRFGEAYHDALKDAKDVTVMLQANVTDIECADSVTAVRCIHAVSMNGKEVTVKAHIFVLACGGLENPRILLTARRQNKKGLGNDHDLVGRYFMDHLEGVVGHVAIGSKANGRWASIYEKRLAPGSSTQTLTAVRLSRNVQEQRRILNIAFNIISIKDNNTGYMSAKRLAIRMKSMLGEKYSQYLLKGHSLKDDVANLITDLDEVALWIHHRMRSTHYQFPVTDAPVTFKALVEQAPNPDSRVVLAQEKDELGMPRIALEWRLGQLEKVTLLESSKILAAEISRTTGLRVKLQEWLFSGDAEIPTTVHGGHHHMGTTRMGDTPKTGVVDKNCQVYGIKNLYVAGSSVFPTCGYVNPTLTIVALAVRLAHYIDNQLDISKNASG